MKALFTLITCILITSNLLSQSGPELVFENPVLVSGTANKPGAVYRFSNVATGVDATVKIKYFSTSSIVMSTIDNGSLGWSKAFQPEFGLPGLVQPNKNWYVDFEMTFYKAGTNSKQKMDTIDLTALDVDGDGNSIREYVTYDNPSSISYSTLSFLTSAATGVLGQTYECIQDLLPSILITCLDCGGDGVTNSGPGNNNLCTACDGSGKRHLLCGHAYEGGSGNTVTGPLNNFTAIDTNATQVMATYQFLNRDRIKFRYGGKSGALSSNGSGIRLNSTWFREFSLAPISILPLKMETFSATLNDEKNAELKWTTSSEVNVSHFVVEKSTDGIHFKDAAIVFAYGSNGAKTNYSFTDKLTNEQATVIYYRIRSVDLDEKTQLSNTRTIRIISKTGNNVTILTYPNPASHELRVTLPAGWQNKKVIFELYNSNGAIVRKAENSHSSQTETLDISALSPGFYMVRVTCNGESARQKIIKQ